MQLFACLCLVNSKIKIYCRQLSSLTEHAHMEIVVPQQTIVKVCVLIFWLREQALQGARGWFKLSFFPIEFLQRRLAGEILIFNLLRNKHLHWHLNLEIILLFFLTHRIISWGTDISISSNWVYQLERKQVLQCLNLLYLKRIYPKKYNINNSNTNKFLLQVID